LLSADANAEPDPNANANANAVGFADSIVKPHIGTKH
jgi:hypothetical protein